MDLRPPGEILITLRQISAAILIMSTQLEPLTGNWASTTFLYEVQGPSLVRMAASMTWMKNSSCMDLLRAAKLWRPFIMSTQLEPLTGNWASTTFLYEVQGPSLVRMAASMTWMKNSRGENPPPRWPMETAWGHRWSRSGAAGHGCGEY